MFSLIKTGILKTKRILIDRKAEMEHGLSYLTNAIFTKEKLSKFMTISYVSKSLNNLYSFYLLVLLHMNYIEFLLC